MPKIRRSASGLRVQLTAEEVWILGSVVGSLDDLLAGDPGPGGAAAGLPDGLSALDWPATPVEPPADPALRRLLPDAYSDDDAAAAEFRRYTDGSLRDGMRADAAVVAAALAEVADGGAIRIGAQDAEAWLRVLTDVRLVLATRLGIARASDQEVLDTLTADDPRSGAYVIYNWLGYVLTDLLDALD